MIVVGTKTGVVGYDYNFSIASAFFGDGSTG